MKTVQYFSDEYLEECRRFSPQEVMEFLENFREMHFSRASQPKKSKLISMKVPEDLLNNFRMKCELHKIAYQTQIKKLMLQWLQNH